MVSTSGEKNWWRTAVTLNWLRLFGSKGDDVALLTAGSGVVNHTAPERGITTPKDVPRRHLDVAAPIQNPKGPDRQCWYWASACVATADLSSSTGHWVGDVLSALLILAIGSPGQMTFRSPPSCLNNLEPLPETLQHLSQQFRRSTKLI